MRLSIPTLLTLLGFLIALPVIGSAEAAKGPLPSFLPPPAKFSLATPNGYAVSVQGRGRVVSLSVGHGPTRATYTVRGRAWPGGMRARFGHFGLVSVRFAPGRRPPRREAPRHSCQGKSALIRSGVFVGKIRFKGEDGYVSVDARRAKGQSSTQPRWRCDRSAYARVSATRRKKPRIEAATLEASLPEERTVFAAVGLFESSGPGLAFFGADTRERRGSVKLQRSGFAIGGRKRMFSFEGNRFAKVTPPKPFHGSAVFRREADGSVSWTGTLSVALPGGPVPLTGTGFKAKLER